MYSYALADNSSVPAAQPTKTTSEEIQLLKAQLQATQHYQEQFLSIIQWSLGSVIAIALGLAAFNWFSSKVSYDRDLKALKSEVTGHIDQELANASNKLENSLQDKEKDITLKILSATKNDFDKINKRLNSHNGRLLNLEYDNIERQAEEALNKKSYTWAIYQLSELMEISVKNGSDSYQVGDILDQISKILDVDGVTLDSDNVIHTTEALKNLPDIYKSAAENLMQKVSKAHK